MWFNGRTPASQAGSGGSIPLIRSNEMTAGSAVILLGTKGIEPERARGLSENSTSYFCLFPSVEVVMTK